MCRFISFFHRPVLGYKDEIEIAVFNLSNHLQTQAKLRLDLTWHEGHYTPQGKLELRFPPDKDKPEFYDANFKFKYPDFWSFLRWCLTCDIAGDINLSRCKIPAGLKFPESVSGWLDLGGCKIPPGLKLPESVGGSLYLSGCTLPAGLKLPAEITGDLNLSGCTIPAGFVLPAHVGGKIYR